MTCKVAALYQFVALPDFRDLRPPLRALCERLGLKGTLLLAPEGLNGTLAGTASAIDALVHELQHGALFGARLDNLELKFSTAAEMPFRRLKVRLKKEIVTFGDRRADPSRAVGTYVDAAAWNALLLLSNLGGAPCEAKGVSSEMVSFGRVWRSREFQPPTGLTTRYLTTHQSEALRLCHGVRPAGSDPIRPIALAAVAA